MPDENGVWTKEAILKYVDDKFENMEKQTAINNGHVKEYLSDKIQSQKEMVKITMMASKEAVHKAEMANERRFESVNEFRGQLKDHAATLMPRAEVQLLIDSLNKNIAENRTHIQTQLGANQGKQEVRSSFKDYIGYILAGIAMFGFIIERLLI